MNSNSRLSVLALIALALLAGSLVAQAQGPGKDIRPEPNDSVSQRAPNAAIEGGIGSDAPAGFATLFIFTGVANEAGNGSDEATSVNCTNYHPSQSVEVRVEIYGYYAVLGWGSNQTIPPGATRTWSTQAIEAYNDGDILPMVGFISQGSGRVLVKEHTQVICNAQVLDADADPPVYAVDLEMFRR